MSRVHLQYEMLCAFAALGELSDAELSDLTAHVGACSSCCRRLAEMEAASYTYFVRHAAKANGAVTPPGMQQRFEERAGSMGIPLREASAALPGNRLISLALSVVLLTVAAQVGWKVLYPQIRGQTPVHVETSSFESLDKRPSTPSLRLSDPPFHRASLGRLSGGRKTRPLRRAGTFSSPLRDTSKAQSYSPPLRLLDSEAFADDRPLRTPVVVRDYLTSGISFPAKRTFELTSASRFLADGEYSIPAKRAFRYNPTFASLSFLGMPARVEVPHFPAMSEPPALFRINSTKAW